MTELLGTVREQTRQAHQRLEEALALEERVLTPAWYLGLLRSFAGFYGPMEARLGAFTQWQSVGIDYACRCKLTWIQRDLVALGDPSGVADLPQCATLPPMETFVQAVGCAYVLEGATLGGQHILRVVRARLDVTPQDGACFFHSYGPEVGTMWRQFQRAMVHAADTPAKQRELITSADQTFAALHTWLSQTGGLLR